MSTPLATLYTASVVKLRALRLQFDNSLTGARRSLLWNDAKAVDYSNQLVDCGPIRHTMETDLFAAETTDLELTLTNLGAGGASRSYGFWDQAWTTFALKPLYNILARVSCAVWDDAIGDWSAWTPLYTGLVDDLVTSVPEIQAGKTVDGGRATMQLVGVPSVLTEEAASEVRNGDSYYAQLSIDRALKLLLTQKDRWAPINAPNVPVSVTARTGTTLTVTRTDGGAWSVDASGAHPAGVLAGYVLCLTTGPWAGNPYIIATQTGSGATVTLTFAGSAAPTAGVGDAGVVTGYCAPYLDLSVGGTQTAFPAFHELTSHDIRSVTQIPTQDGRWVLSAWGRPPEDSTAGVCEAIAHDGTMTWLGVDNKLYRFTETTGVYTLVATLTGDLATAKFRRAFWWPDSGYVWLFAWPDDDTTPERTARVFRVQAGTGAPTGQSWTSASAYITVPHFWPGDLAYRHSLTSWNQSGSTPEDLFAGFAGRLHAYDALGNAHRYNTSMNIPCFVPQALRCVEQEAVQNEDFEVLRGAGLLSTLNVTWPDDGAAREPSPLGVTAPWTYVSTLARSQYAGSLVYARYGVQYHLGGSYQILPMVTPGAAQQGLVFWTRDATAKTFTLNSINYATGYWGPLGSSALFGEPEGLHGPAALWLGNSGTALYAAFNVYGNETTNTATARTQVKVWSLLLSTYTPSLVWQTSATSDDDASYLFVNACGVNGMRGVGCLMAAGAPSDVTLAGSTPRQRFLLVQQLEDTQCWTNRVANTLMQSRTPWTHFTQAVDGRAWFLHYGDNTLWSASNGAWGEMTGRLQSTVFGDQTAASQLCITPEATPRVLGVSAGDLLRLYPSSTPPVGKFYWWQYAPWFAPRIPGLWESGSRWDGAKHLAQLAQYALTGDAAALLHFAPRTTAPVDWALSGLRARALTKRRPKAQLYTRITCGSTVGVIGQPDVSYTAVNVDATGSALEGRAFNGGVYVRPGDTATKRLRLVCVAGSQATAADGEALDPSTTAWRIYCATSSPQWTGSAAAYPYPGGWWNLPSGDGTTRHNVWLKIENTDAAGVTAVGFAPGDVLDLTVPGLQPQDAPAGRVTVPNPTAEQTYRVRTYAIDNPLVPEGMEVDLALALSTPLGTLPTVIEYDGTLRPDIAALDVANISYQLLNTFDTGFVTALTHTVPAPTSGAAPHTELTVRTWTPHSPAAAQAMPTPTPPPAEPT